MPGRPIALACLLLAFAIAPAPLAIAQDTTPSTTVVPPINPSENELDGGTTPGGLTPTQTTPDDVAPDDAELPPASETTAPAATTPGSATPTPPPYLSPGQGAQVQPVSSVANLSDPDVPLEPLRLAALAAALIATLLLGGAVVLRNLGVRTASTPAVVTTSSAGPLSRARERLNTLADDVRDFLRHSR